MANQTEPNPQRTGSRRDEILAVAAIVIAERGLAGATVRDIGQAAGILSGSLYHHFNSKEQIVLDLLFDNVQASIERATSIISDAPDATTAIGDLIRDSITETAKHPNESLILRNETRAFRDTPALAPLAELRQASVALWVDAVNRGISSGDFRTDLDPQVTVMAIVDSVLGAARWFRDAEGKDPDRVAESLATLHLGGLVQTSTS